MTFGFVLLLMETMLCKEVLGSAPGKDAVSMTCTALLVHNSKIQDQAEHNFCTVDCANMGEDLCHECMSNRSLKPGKAES